MTSRTHSTWEVAAAAVIDEAATDPHPERVADLIARLASTPDGFPVWKSVFTLLEAAGFHLTPVHFYSPIPDVGRIPEQVWHDSSELIGIEMNESFQLWLLDEVFPRFQDEVNAIPVGQQTDERRFCLGNNVFDGVDALAFYCMIRWLGPSEIIEVGSGHSTRLASEALKINESGTLVCIDPRPDPALADGLPDNTELIAEEVQSVDVARFERLGAGDVLFIDSSHVARLGGDVTFLFLEVMPRLAPGVVVHIHDIFLPKSYPKAWFTESRWFWNEQYVLQAFLAFNREFEIMLANAYLAQEHYDELKMAFPKSPWWNQGGSLWMRRVEAN
jgi:hypothetical protein